MKAHFGFNGISVRCFGVLKRGAAACGSGVGGVAVRLRLAQSLFKLGIHGIAAVALRLALVKKALRSCGQCRSFRRIRASAHFGGFAFSRNSFSAARSSLCASERASSADCAARFALSRAFARSRAPALCAFGSGSIAMNGANLLSANRQLAGEGDVDKFSGMLGVDEFFNFQ